MSTDQTLSCEQLRDRLYTSLRDRGLVDNIKSQLRNSLVTELQHSIQGPLTLKDLRIQEGGTLLHRASNSLVANHLRACQYEYSLSVFLPECGLNQDKKFATADLLKLLNISSESRLYQQLNANLQENSRQGFLMQLLTEVCSLHSNSIHSVGCQTDLLRIGPITPLDAKLSSVDKLYLSSHDALLQSRKAGAEERMLNFQRQLEDRYNTQLKLELARLKDSEIAAVKMQEKDECRKALEQQRRDLERVYKEKHDGLVLRERNTNERLQQQMELQERETYAQRQTILEEIEAVRQRESEIMREAEVYKREKRLLEDRIKDKESDLRRREVDIKQKETSFENRLQNEMAQFKLGQQTRYIERIQNIETREATVKEGERIVAEEKAHLQEVKDELRNKTHRVNELETLLSEAKYKEINANKNNEYLNTKLRDMSDYATLKEQVVVYRNELETVKTRLAEVLTMNERERGRQEELLRELRRPSPESLLLHRDLERAKESLRQEQIVFNQQKQMLEARLKEELDRNRELLQRFEEQILQMREMNREIVDLRQQLHLTTRALNQEVYKKPNNDNDGHSMDVSIKSQKGGSFTAKKSTDLNPSIRRSLTFEADVRDVYHYVDSPPLLAHTDRDYRDDDNDASSVDSADFIAHTKYRLMNLDKEANNLEKAYHEFHCRLTNVTALGLTSCPQDAGKSDQQKHPDPASPRQSPVPLNHPMSSTPYKNMKNHRELNDSFSDLVPRTQSIASLGPQLEMSSMANVEKMGHISQKVGERREKMRTITVDDLKQRPGSPGVIVVTESASSDEGKRQLESGHKILSQDNFHTSRLAEVGIEQATIVSRSTSTVQPMSLDSVWIQQQETTGRTVIRTQEGTEGMNKQNPEGETKVTEIDKTGTVADEEEIDPVMRGYMARVMEQKHREKQVTQKAQTVLQWQPSGERSPVNSESGDMSVAEEVISEQGDDDSW